MTPFAAAAGVLADHFVGEPPTQWHPVARFGSFMQRVEGRLYADRRANGIAFAMVGGGLGVGAGLVMRRAFGARVATVLATCVCAAGRMLDDEANAMSRLLTADDLSAARARVRSLVGRTPDELDENELSRAVVESVAENCVDAVTSSLFWASIGGAPLVLAHRAINTLDAMVGHHDDRYERFGWASARLDDAVNYVPARITAVAVMLARPARARPIVAAVRRDAPQHPSPNGGVIESAFAAALGVSLGGVNRYGDIIEDRGTLGGGPPPTVDTITDAISLRRRSTAIVAVLLIGIWVLS